ncbi:hypothetical protein CBR_g85 [Chara braunii]|uniref:Uncharacterized protein n=1 Tax=Chara braunii TaxID=69332 RepID=A0A388JLJ7_CHABU|nr:hypothetical protein CBR_g85 [Chara braunii]|eukprot:GBG58684.1 hypothetical protein CBR_g85 [Chara braunii]
MPNRYWLYQPPGRRWHRLQLERLWRIRTAEPRRENADLKRVEADMTQKMEGELGALKWEIRDLKEGRDNMGRSDLAKQIEDLRMEMEALRKRNEETEEVAELWRNEALRLGNKRGSINVFTPATEGRTATRTRISGSSEEARRLRVQLSDLQERRKCDQTEVDMLKERRTLAEARRMEAENELVRLQEQLARLTTEQAGCSSPKERGTNLKERMEEAAKTGFRSGKKSKVKATPGRMARPDDGIAKANDRFGFLQDERKRFRALKKAGLEPLCQEAGIKYKTMDISVEEVAQINAAKMFGEDSGPKEGVHGDRSHGKMVSDDSNVAVVEEAPSDSA